MKHIKKYQLAFALLLSNLSFGVIAGGYGYYHDDNYQVVFDMQSCVRDNTRECKQVVCIPLAGGDCVAQCQLDAIQKCNMIAQQTM